jgi:hypothetical protein
MKCKNWGYVMAVFKDSFNGPERTADRDERIPKRMAAKLCRLNGERVPVRIGNLSRNGVEVESAKKFEIGEAITLLVDGMGEYEGVVRWHRNNNIGIHTIDTINIGFLSARN